jgi:hypothetical protein
MELWRGQSINQRLELVKKINYKWFLQVLLVNKKKQKEPIPRHRIPHLSRVSRRQATGRFLGPQGLARWPLHDGDVPTMYKAYFWGLNFREYIPTIHMARNMVLTYLHFRILKLWLTVWIINFREIRSGTRKCFFFSRPSGRVKALFVVAVGDKPTLDCQMVLYQHGR